MKHLRGTPWQQEWKRCSNWRAMVERPRKKLIVPSRPWYTVHEQIRDTLP